MITAKRCYYTIFTECSSEFQVSKPKIYLHMFAQIHGGLTIRSLTAHPQKNASERISSLPCSLRTKKALNPDLMKLADPSPSQLHNYEQVLCIGMC